MILMVQQRKQVAYGKWSLPGGRTEDGETSDQAVEREVQEELGVSLVSKKFYKEYEFIKPDYAIEISTYIGQIDAPIHLKDDELLAYGWFSLDSVAELNEAGRLRNPALFELASEVLEKVK